AERATAIHMQSNGSLVREYRLSYESTAAEIADPDAAGAVPLQLSLLTKITQFDNLGQNYLPPLRLGYTQLNVPNPPTVHTMANPPQTLAQRLINGTADLLDVNGDGLPDVLDTTDTVHHYYPNLGRDRFGPNALVMSIGGDPTAITNATL